LLLSGAGSQPKPKQVTAMTLTEFPDVGRVEHVAAVLDCSKWCVYDLIGSGELKAIRLGRALRVTKRALEEFLAA
jgi:excisionase family DNA binding protein